MADAIACAKNTTTCAADAVAGTKDAVASESNATASITVPEPSVLEKPRFLREAGHRERDSRVRRGHLAVSLRDGGYFFAPGFASGFGAGFGSVLRGKSSVRNGVTGSPSLV